MRRTASPVRARARALQWSLSLGWRGWTLDSTPPEIEITTPSDGTTIELGDELDIEISAEDDDVVLEVTLELDAASVEQWLEPPFTATLSGLELGEYRLVAHARDRAGHWGESTVAMVKVVEPGSSESTGQNSDSSDSSGSSQDSGTSSATSGDDADASDAETEGHDDGDASDASGDDQAGEEFASAGESNGDVVVSCGCFSARASGGWLQYSLVLIGLVFGLRRHRISRSAQ